MKACLSERMRELIRTQPELMSMIRNVPIPFICAFKENEKFKEAKVFYDKEKMIHIKISDLQE